MSRLREAQRLQNYLERYGAQISRQIEIYENAQGNLSLRTNRAIRCLDIVASIPAHLCLVGTERYIPQSKTYSPDAHIGLAIQLIEEKKKHDSKFKLHIATLPDDISTYPHAWTADTLDLFKGSTLHHMFVDIQPQQHLDNLGSYSDLSVWAHSMVRSRSFGQGGTLALVPFLDIAGHDSKMCVEPIGSRGFMVLKGESTINRGVQSYNLVALADHPPGAEIRHSYGNISFEDKLMGYGWLDTDTPLTDYSHVNMALPFTPSQRYYGRKPLRTLLCQFNLQERRMGPSVSTFLTENGVGKRTLINALRRRHRDLEDMLQDCKPLMVNGGRPSIAASASLSDDAVVQGHVGSSSCHSTPSQSTALTILPNQPTATVSPEVRESWPRIILQRDAESVSHLLTYLQSDEGYMSYRNREKEVLEQLEEEDEKEAKNTAAYLLLLLEATGLDILEDAAMDSDNENDDNADEDDDNDDNNSNEEGDSDANKCIGSSHREGHGYSEDSKETNVPTVDGHVVSDESSSSTLSRTEKKTATTD